MDPGPQGPPHSHPGNSHAHAQPVAGFPDTCARRCGRTSTHPEYHDPHPTCAHTHPRHRDPEYDHRAREATRRLWVITAVSNPVRFKSRYGLYRRFRHHVTRELGLGLITVEAAFGDREFQLSDDASEDSVLISDRDGVRTIDVRVRNASQVWLKENLWNIGARYLPNDCEYVLFADADIRFLGDHFPTELVHSLQEYRVVQPFETAADLGPEGQIIDVHRSFGWCHAHGWEWRPRPDGKGGYCSRKPDHVDRHQGFGNAWHPGFALAMRRSVLDRLPVLEVGVLGAGDHHMCAGLIGRADLSYPGGIHDNYKRQVLRWQARAAEVVNGSFGYTPGSILHEFHGAKKNRRYASRWDILVKHAYDPDADVYRNAHGVLELEDRVPALRDAIRGYFRQRDEDGVSVV